MTGYICSLLLVILHLFQACETKGVYGSSRGGGGYRSYRSGYYSRSYGYRYTPYMMYGHSHYHCVGTCLTDAEVDAQMLNVFCKRKISVNRTLSTMVTNSGRTYPKNVLVLDSVRDCWHEVSPQPYAVTNLPVTDLILLDLFRATASHSQGTGPALGLQLFDNYLSPVDPLFHAKISIDSIDVTGACAETVNFTALTWSDFGYPSASHIDHTKLIIVSTTASSNSWTFTLTFKIADDFLEDDRLVMNRNSTIFFRPSLASVQIDAVPIGLSGNHCTEASTGGGTRFAINATVTGPEDKVSTASVILRETTLPTTLPVSYDPWLLLRVQLGNLFSLDGDTRSTGYVAVSHGMIPINPQDEVDVYSSATQLTLMSYNASLTLNSSFLPPAPLVFGNASRQVQITHTGLMESALSMSLFIGSMDSTEQPEVDSAVGLGPSLLVLMFATASMLVYL